MNNQLDPFSKLIDKITEPTEAEKWLTSDHVTKTLQDWREEND